MTNPIAPVKTPLGQQELRQRTHGLGQRFRTILLLVDGRRPLAEVLHMAHMAGAQTSHFDRLVQLGMVELPREPASAAPDPACVPEVELPERQALSPLVEGPVDPAPALAPTPAEQAAAGTEVAESAPAPQPVDADAPPALPAPSLPLAPQPGPPVADAERGPKPLPDDAQMLEEVRKLLLDILRRDTLLYRAFAPGRVRGAQTQDELIGLVWEIERERAHARRKRGQLLNLQRARELLGMGNTLVADDSLQGPPSVQ